MCLITSPILIKLIYICLIFLLIVIIFFVFEGYRIVRNVRRISDRIEILTNIKEWVNFTKIIHFFMKKKK